MHEVKKSTKNKQGMAHGGDVLKDAPRIG